MAYTKIAVYPVLGNTPWEEAILEIISNFKNKPISVDRFQLGDGQLLVVETSKEEVTGMIIASMIFVDHTQECIDVPENDLEMIIPEVTKVLRSSRRVVPSILSVVGNTDIMFFIHED